MISNVNRETTLTPSTYSSTISNVNKETNEYPLYEGDIRLIYPDMSDEFILPAHFAEVPESAFPSITETQIASEVAPQLNADGFYERVYVIRDLTEQELQYNQKQVAFYLGGMQPEIDPNAVPQPEL
jgi:hypothetical protein